METGIGLIVSERQEQIEKHSQSIVDDVNRNPMGELAKGAVGLIDLGYPKPFNWDEKRWHYMKSKPRKERIVIAAALLAAELDRIIYLEKLEQQSKP